MVAIANALQGTGAIEDTANMLQVVIDDAPFGEEARIALERMGQSRPGDVLLRSPEVVPVVAQRKDQLDAVRRCASEHQIQSAKRDSVILQRSRLDRAVPDLFRSVVGGPGADDGH